MVNDRLHVAVNADSNVMSANDRLTADITSNVAVQQKLQATYGTVDQIDPFEGMLAEDHVSGDVGPTIKAILADQFQRLRVGDRYFYLNETLSFEELNLIAQGNTLAKVIQDNTAINNLQANVFLFKLNIEGTVFFDAAGTGIRTSTDPGVQGIVVNLLDDQGNVVATTTTDANGHYSFSDQTGIPGTGNYSVMVMVPTGYQSTTVITHAIHLSRGGLDYDGEDFGINTSM